MNQSCNFNVLLDFESSEPYVPILFYEERLKPDNLAIIKNYDTHTHTHTNGHGDSMTNPARVSENILKTKMILKSANVKWNKLLGGTDPR